MTVLMTVVIVGQTAEEVDECTNLPRQGCVDFVQRPLVQPGSHEISQ